MDKKYLENKINDKYEEVQSKITIVVLSSVLRNLITIVLGIIFKNSNLTMLGLCFGLIGLALPIVIGHLYLNHIFKNYEKLYHINIIY